MKKKVFYVDVGSLSKKKAKKYIRKFMKNYRKTCDSVVMKAVEV